uniref:Uncharacterized protein n=1 Tax=Podoviridae sp. ct8Lf7 TaxID=2827723 RepID=A0A8S5S0D2_9CAUD|nr:MAG TPA: hypothetical protein [Podoviridae sp. ct8Lf7]
MILHPNSLSILLRNKYIHNLTYVNNPLEDKLHK